VTAASLSPAQAILAARILDALPQTQCTRCAYPDCAGYAQAIATGEAGIDRCPPGGVEGIHRLAQITRQRVTNLNPECGVEGPRQVAFIDENWCIGCTLCLDACPVDAIVGSNKRMHTVIEPHCTGCALCLPVCPVDCILLEDASGSATGWQAWSAEQAARARQRYALHSERLRLQAAEATIRQEEKASETLANLAAHSRHTDPAVLERKRQVINAALERARARRAGPDRP
jgi:electron transport complex protein RnfB